MTFLAQKRFDIVSTFLYRLVVVSHLHSRSQDPEGKKFQTT